MELVRLGAGKWEVLAMCTGDQDELVKVLEDPDNQASGSSARMLRLLGAFIPHQGQPKNRQKFRRIEGGTDRIWEAKECGGLRAYCFRDGRRYVITHAAKKPPDKRVPIEERRAARLCDGYFAAKSANQLVITGLGRKNHG